MSKWREEKIFDYEKAHELFRYDGKTGKLYRRAGTVNTRKDEFEVSGTDGNGNLGCNVFGTRKLVKNIVILMNTGLWPGFGVVHKDGNLLNNKMDNLEVLTREKHLEIYSAFDGKDKNEPGIMYNRRTRLYTVALKWHGVILHKGECKTKERAISIRNSAYGVIGVF